MVQNDPSGAVNSGQQDDAGLDIDGQIKQGVMAFMQSQDPAIAVEVVKMLAEMMGIAPQINAYEDEQQEQSVPEGRRGMRFYKKGGKMYGNGGSTDPDPKPKKTFRSTLVDARSTKTRIFIPQDMGAGRVQNRMTTPEMGKQLGERPSKTQKRIAVQTAGVQGQDVTGAGGYLAGNNVLYDEGNRKGELAGHVSDIQFDLPPVTNDLPVLDIERDNELPEINIPQIPASEIRQKNGRRVIRRLPRVPWLPGQNPKTESGYGQ